MTKFDQMLQKFINKYMPYLCIGAILLFTLIARVHLAPITMLSADYNEQLLAWVDHYKTMGIVAGLSEKVGDYYVPYNLMVALISILPCKPWQVFVLVSFICEYVSALYVYRIIRYLSKPGKVSNMSAALVAIATLMLPVTVLDGALWKQSDAVYTCFILISFYQAIREKYTSGIVILALAFVIKLQAIFFLPFYIILYLIGKKFSIFQFLWFPGMYAIAGLPAILCGRSITNTYGTYFKQMGEDNAMAINIPNIYYLGLADYPALYIPALCATVCILAIMTYCVFRKKDSIDGVMMLYLAAWILWTCAMFLPNMRERYDYMAIIFITVYMLAFRRSKVWIAIVINLISIETYSGYLFSQYAQTISCKWLAVPYVLSYCAMTYDLLKAINEKNPASF